jgi:hypothetical protein
MTMFLKKILFGISIVAIASSCQKIPQSDPSSFVMHSVEGKVQCLQGNSMKDVTITINVNNRTFSTLTDNNGSFKFSDVPAGTDVEIVASFIDTRPFSGTTLGVVMLQKIINDPALLKGRLSELACDMDKNGIVDTTDINNYMSRILTRNTTIEWIFVPNNFHVGKDGNRKILINNLNKDESALLFVGTQLGDPQGSRCK